MTENVESVEPLRFSWSVPDRLGIWAYAGQIQSAGPATERVTREEVTSLSAVRWGWWSWLMELPDSDPAVGLLQFQESMTRYNAENLRQ